MSYAARLLASNNDKVRLCIQMIIQSTLCILDFAYLFGNDRRIKSGVNFNNCL